MYKIQTDAQAADIFTKPFKDVKRWAAVRDLVLVVYIKECWRCAVSGAGVIRANQRCQETQRRER
eukprot:10085449-Alexandrium_andersonii.AAC.1